MSEWAQAENERILANMIRVGVIAQLDEVNARVTVRAGGLTTDWLPWLTMRAGGDRTWWAPEPGEQVLVLSPYGDPAQAVVLPSIYQDAHPAPGNVRTTSRVEFKDGAFVQYDREGHHYHLDVPAGGSITLHIGSTTLLLEDGKTTLTTPELLVDSPKSTFTGAVNVQGLLTYLAGMVGKGGGGATASIQGSVAVTGGDVTADGVSLKGHTHPGDSGGTTGAPN
ncbi:MAG TPA: phage baseplate assembly protein V [Rhodocyclaceae bacterium]|nr:phage baseplate assembly protein V [Rhodocyclaceae bacterium]